jgi:hypothetical protein
VSEYKEGVTIHLVPRDVGEQVLRYAKERARRLGDCEDVVPMAELSVYPTFECAPALCSLCYERRTKMGLLAREHLQIELQIINERGRPSA